MDDTTSNMACRACGAPSTEPITTTNFFLPEKDPCQWTDGFCSNCGSLSHFSNSATALTTYHDSSYRDEGYEVAPPVSLPWSTVTFERHRHISRLLSPYLEHRPDQSQQPLRHLDFGGYTGFMSYGLGQVFNLRSTVADLDPRGLRVAAALEMETVDLSSSALPQDSFDLVTAVHVVEHIDDPVSSLEAILQSMNQAGGLFYCEVPNVLKFPSRNPSHYSNFSLRGARDLFVRSGFKVLDLGYCQTPPVAVAFSWPYFSPKENIYLIATNCSSAFVTNQPSNEDDMGQLIADSDFLDHSLFQRQLHISGARLGLRNSIFYAQRGAKSLIANSVKALISLLLLAMPSTRLQNLLTKFITRSKRLETLRTS